MLSDNESARWVIDRRLAEWRRHAEVVGELILVIAMNLREVMRFDVQDERAEDVMDRDSGFIAERGQVNFDRHGIEFHGVLQGNHRAAARRDAGGSGWAKTSR